MKLLLLCGVLLAAAAVATAFVLFLDGPDPFVSSTPSPEAAPDDFLQEDVPGDSMSVSGRVVDPAGAPLASVEVYLLSPDDPLVPAAAPRRIRTGEDGTFLLRGREEGRQDIIAYRSGFRPGVVPDVSPGTTHRMTLLPGVVVNGFVIDDLGRPLAGVRVTGRTTGMNFVPSRGIFLPNHAAVDLTWVRTLSGSDGGFKLSGVGEGLLDITAEKRGYPGMEFPLDGIDPTRGPARIVMLRPFTASITVRDAESGKPLPRIVVTVSRVDAEKEQASGRTNHRGVFTGRMPWPAAQAPECRVSIIAWEHRYGEIRADGIALAKVEEGKGFTLHAVRREPGVVRIHVAYDTGEAYPGWMGFMFEISPKVNQYRGGRIDEEGFVTMSVPAGNYRTVRVVGSGTVGKAEIPGVRVVSGETTEERLVLERGGDLEISFVGDDAPDHVVGRVRLEASGFNETLGIWGQGLTIRDLPPGDMKLTVEPRDFKPTSIDVRIRKGKKVEVPVKLRRR